MGITETHVQEGTEDHLYLQGPLTYGSLQILREAYWLLHTLLRFIKG
jgi:hypothetical protein